VISRRALAIGLGALWPAAASSAQTPLLLLSGEPIQGGGLIGRTRPRARILIDGQPVGYASAYGLFFVGFDRDAKPDTVITAETSDGPASRALTVAPGSFDIQAIDGLPTDQVTPQDPALLIRIGEEARRKQAGFANWADTDDFRDGFSMPVAATRISGRFGGQRILNGNPSRPHYGTDLAAPVGAPVIAPAPGLVVFSETGLHFEGGLVLIDHGQGLISAYLHMSRLDTAKGDVLRRGDPIGAVGQEGRATGPHLCWRLKWHERNLDPMRLVGISAPAAA